jgi:hypothetical protein
MSDPLRVLRIVISGRGDVVEERHQARRVIEGLQKRYPDVALQPVLWEDLALPATASFQETIDLIQHQSPIDIAVFVLWSRLGTRVSRPDGTPYRSGTEREFDLMRTAFEHFHHLLAAVIGISNQAALAGIDHEVHELQWNLADQHGNLVGNFEHIDGAAPVLNRQSHGFVLRGGRRSFRGDRVFRPNGRQSQALNHLRGQ